MGRQAVVRLWAGCWFTREGGSTGNPHNLRAADHACCRHARTWPTVVSLNFRKGKDLRYGGQQFTKSMCRNTEQQTPLLPSPEPLHQSHCCLSLQLNLNWVRVPLLHRSGCINPRKSHASSLSWSTLFSLKFRPMNSWIRYCIYFFIPSTIILIG